MSRREERESGAAAVEFALVVPLLLLLVLGMVNFGRAYNAQITLTQAAREGVRGLALQLPGYDAVARTKAAAAPQYQSMTVTQSACAASPAPTDDAEVDASVSITIIPGLNALMAHFGGSGPGSITVHGKGVMRCGG
jgi:Flp pilus assembly protein TadG